MDTRLVSESFRIIGVKKTCLFKEFPTALPEAKEAFYEKVASKAAYTEIIAYKMNEEEAYPERNERFYFGCEEEVPVLSGDGLEVVRIESCSFVTTTYRGDIREVWRGYESIKRFIKDNKLEEDKASYAVERYDSRYRPDSDESEMEIYIPVKPT